MAYLINNNILADDVTAIFDMGKYYLSNARYVNGTACRSYIDVANVESIKLIDSFVDLI